MPIEAGIAAKLPLLEGISSWEELFSDPGKREQMDRFTLPDRPYTPPDVLIEERTAPGPHGPVPVRIYRPDSTSVGGRPALVWMHGGAFVGGDLNMAESDWVSREVAVRAGAVVVAVDYRLARPGLHFPFPTTTS